MFCRLQAHERASEIAEIAIDQPQTRHEVPKPLSSRAKHTTYAVVNYLSDSISSLVPPRRVRQRCNPSCHSHRSSISLLTVPTQIIHALTLNFWFTPKDATRVAARDVASRVGDVDRRSNVLPFHLHTIFHLLVTLLLQYMERRLPYCFCPITCILFTDIRRHRDRISHCQTCEGRVAAFFLCVPWISQSRLKFYILRKSIGFFSMLELPGLFFS